VGEGIDAFVARIFIGPKGIRPGWRILLSVIFFIGVNRVFGFVIRHIPAAVTFFQGAPRGVIASNVLILSDGLTALALVIAVFLMSIIEKRSFADYGLPLREAFGKRFWQGIPFGFILLSLLLGTIAVFHGFSLGGPGVAVPAAIKYGLLFFIGFLFVAILEEFSFRGYLQSTLASGVGFWPAALVLSFIFGYIHLGNPGEAKVGAVMAGAFGLLAAFSLQRTGNIWFAIGMHTSWDWAETFFYSVPDSGLPAKGSLLTSGFHGAAWLTGGSVGPEGSFLVFPILFIGAIGIHLLFPARKMESAQSLN
jgi:membrane protease YdiL (CAAX protease family)